MPAAPRITPQDPSHSPTLGLAVNQAEHTIPPPTRRNLFSAHLSRRPVSTSTSNLLGPSSPTLQSAHSRYDVFSSGPTLHPAKRPMDVKDMYDDPDASPPNHHLSSSAGTTLFPRDSIIGLHPVTGRPLLPNLPALPARLRINEDDEREEEGSDEDMEPNGYLGHGRPYPHSPSHSRNFVPSSDFDFEPDIDLDSSDLNFIGISRGRDTVHSFIEPADSDDSRRGRERIERLLAEMMSKQRARARTLNVPESSNDGSTSSSTSRVTRGSTDRTRRTGKASTRFEKQRQQQQHLQSLAEPAVGGVGPTMDPAERDELMGLIMTSLRRKLQQAEDEGWIYGGAEGLGGIGMGADLASDAVYD